MKTLTVFFLCCLVAFSAYSQHYYNDLIIAREIMKKRELYRQQQVRTVQVNSFDGNQQPIEGFSSQQTVNGQYSEISTVTTDPLGGATRNTAFFNAAGQLTHTVDTSEGNKTTINYAYDSKNRISRISSVSVSPGNYTIQEQHNWTYDEQDRPVNMVKIKNDLDTTYISFVPDEQGNPGEEKSIHKGQSQPTVYYYFDDKNRLTDIVRYNERAKKLLPDYIFEYDSQGRPASMLVTIAGTSDYQKWHYSYNDKGLKERDECYSKTRALIGRMEYRYNN